MEVGDQIVDHSKFEPGSYVEFAPVLHRNQPVILIDAGFQRSDRGCADCPDFSAIGFGSVYQLRG